ncbi:TPA_asm: hypothetical protein GIN61_08495 [Listeria monocytogenes]|uniref:hypothetical protein n=1 Tax=Listeria monocytogenes TaxID=1639 RepID=UPI0010E12A3C|nr:hypothetical protein [Listeria monocytogenes]EAE4235101.1 hypothetical protein [Listeria monocytogenes]EKG5451807.1 hypothetical protein [Listeria monocytogenes]MBC3571005.1 hypothetical protein [Listeria monocytogenes]HAA6170897.1 hypothetical protein [Listeria monocytogenes]HAA9026170.1 hypothetical protein [Listeria monocytogenes]
MPKDMLEPIQRWEFEALKKDVEKLSKDKAALKGELDDFIKEREKDRKLSLNVISGALVSLVVGILTFLITRGF